MLHNIIKHADARKVEIKVEASGDQVILAITDDGCGFDSDKLREDSEKRFGLFSIQERVSQLGGKMELNTAPGKGTQVRLIVSGAGRE